MTLAIDNADWPTFGWSDDIRPALARAIAGGRPAVLATLYRVEGSAPRGPGAQMLFDGQSARGYFSGDCIEGDVAAHAGEVMADGKPRWLHYGEGSPWIDIRLRCGGALFILVERIAPDCPAALALLDHARTRQPCRWQSNGIDQRLAPGGDGPLLQLAGDANSFSRRYDPPKRLIVTGGDPGALAAAQLAMLAGFETIILRPLGPQSPPPFAVSGYVRSDPAQAVAEIGVDRWTAYLGATHEDHHDLGGCLTALKGGAGYVGMIGARSRAEARIAALKAAGASQQQIDQLHLKPGLSGLGKAPFEVATGIMCEIMQVLGAANERT